MFIVKCKPKKRKVALHFTQRFTLILYSLKPDDIR